MMMMTGLTGVITWCSSFQPPKPWAQTLVLTVMFPSELCEVPILLVALLNGGPCDGLGSVTAVGLVRNLQTAYRSKGRQQVLGMSLLR